MTINPLGDMTDIFVAVILMFLVPILEVNDMEEKILQDYVYRQAENFVKSADINRSISRQNYSELIDSVGLVGLGAQKGYNVELICSRTVYEPVYESGVFSGEVREYVDEYTEEEILNTVRSKGSFSLRAGDHIELRLTRTDGNLSEHFLGTLLGHRYCRSLEYETFIRGGK